MTKKQLARASSRVSMQRKLLALAISQAVLAGAAQSAEILVNSAEDSEATDGLCTLREAVAAANTDTGGDCAAGSGADTIIFDASLNDSTITLSGSEILVSSDVTIQGPGADRLAVSGDNASRIFLVNDGNPDDDRVVNINGLTLSSGSSDNSGGALLSFERLAISQCTLAGSTAANGGAIDNRGTLFLFQSTLSGNTASVRGGGLANYGDSASVTSSTLSGNTAAEIGGGIVSGLGSNLSLTGATLASNGGGGLYTFDPGMTDLVLTLIANSINGNDCTGAGAFISNSLIPTGTCNAQLTADPLLGPLQNNGGTTLTHALAPGSPALDAQPTNYAIADQRGFFNVDGQSDIGAFELGAMGPALVVNAAGDDETVDGLCTLREAVSTANNDTTGDCGTGSGADTITFDPQLIGVTITLAGTQLALQSAVTIQGPGADQLTISGGNSSRIFRIDDEDVAVQQPVTISGLTLTAGNVAGSGGAIYNFENLTVDASTLSGNTAITGGGMDNRATVTLTNSTVSDNTANERGGALSHYGITATVTNSTLSNNSAVQFAGGIVNAASLTMLNSTLANNAGGGLNSDPDLVNLTNTVIAGSTGNVDCAGGLVVNQNNLIPTGDCDAAITAEPLLGDLQDNGGPTFTHALMRGSPALDAGAAAGCPDSDQRGRPRNDGFCDIGAFEVDANTSLPLVVTTTDDVQADDGQCSLREAVASANLDQAVFASAGECGAGFGPDAITFDPLLNGATITLSGTQIQLESSLEIRGPGANQLTISGDNASRVFLVNDGDPGIVRASSISGLTLTAGNIAGSGGAIYNFENLTLDASTLSGNTADTGGGLDNRGTVTLTNSTLSGNTANVRGGALSHYGNTATVTNSTLSGNSAVEYSGGIVNAASLTILNSTLANNAGGGLITDPGLVSLTNTVMTGSTDNVDCAGGLVVNQNNLIPTGDCDAAITDGALLGELQFNGGTTPTHALMPGSAAIDVGNNANCPETDQRGLTRSDGLCDIGAFEVGTGNTGEILVTTELDVVGDDGLCSLREALAAANLDTAASATSGECQAGFAADTIIFDPSLNGATVTLSEGSLTVSSEVTIQGPGADQLTVSGNNQSRIFAIDDNNGTADLPVTISGLTLADGSSNAGSAILNSEILTIDALALTGNSASGNAGALYNFGTANVQASTFSGNTAAIGGGIVNFSSSTLSLTNSTLSGNSAQAFSGGIFNQGTLTAVNATLANHPISSLYSQGNGTALLTNTLIAGALSGVDCSGGVEPASTNNLIESGDCNADLTSGAMLAPLANNGGPTLTHALMPGSAAIDAGSQDECTNQGIVTDQTGVARPVDGDDDTTAICDIGAFEFVPPEPMPEIDVAGMGVPIADGDTSPDAADDTDFGNVVVNQVLTRTFSISNNGDATLNLTAPVAVSGEGFSVSQPGSTALAPGQNTTFEVSFGPTSVGPVTGTVTIVSDDSDESPYTFAIAGNGRPAGDMIFANGFETPQP